MNEITDEANLSQSVTSEPTEPQYKGVGGWLLLFCLALTVFGPLSTLGSLTIGFNEISMLYELFPRLMVISAIDIILSLSLMAFSIYAGIGLWRVRPGAVRMARRYLLCALAYLAVAAVLPFLTGLPSESNEEMIAEVLKETSRGVLFIAIWYSYLDRSKRVQSTYQA